MGFVLLAYKVIYKANSLDIQTNHQSYKTISVSEYAVIAASSIKRTAEWVKYLRFVNWNPFLGYSALRTWYYPTTGGGLLASGSDPDWGGLVCFSVCP